MRKLVADLRHAAFFLALAILLSAAFSSSASAKLYIDVTSPAARKMPIAVFDLQGPSGGEISEIIRNDLIFSGIFKYVDKSAYIETQSQPFSPGNWTPLGVDAVVKGTVSGDRELSATITLYDVQEGKAILSKQYRAGKPLLRQLAHTIADDIYTAVTGQPGVFRSRIAFIGADDGGKGIFLMDWDGSRIRKVGLKAKDSLILTPHWSHDGTRLIYASERGRQWSIYLLDFARMTERRLFVSRGVNMAGDFFPGGDSFVFSSSRDGTPDLYSFVISSSKLKKLTSSYGIEVSPAVSPDGKSIAFVSDRGGTPQVYIMNSDGSEIRRVSFEGTYNTSPCWSPKGDRIVFAGRKGGRNQIFTVKPDGSELMQLTDSGNNEDPSFSPDGRYIVFSSDRQRPKGIYIMRANGESQQRITPGNRLATSPRWSPN